MVVYASTISVLRIPMPAAAVRQRFARSQRGFAAIDAARRAGGRRKGSAVLWLTNIRGTDLVVSELCLGANKFGTAPDEPQSAAILDRFASLGGTFLDTARCYGDWSPRAPVGASERVIGAWLRG